MVRDEARRLSSATRPAELKCASVWDEMFSQ